MKKRRAGLLLVLLLLFASLFFAHSASAMESTCPPAVIASATLARGETELTIYSDTNKTEKLGKLKKGAIPLAMDESYDPESVQEYGVWEVKKVYLHLYSENRIEMDWNQPFSPDSPISPIFLATEAFDKHRSQQGFSMDRDGVKSDNRIFGLYYTAVGPDEEKNDIFEHIDLQ